MQAPGISRYALAVANRIRELRLEHAKRSPVAFKAAKLADRIGVTESALLRWERGDTRPTKLHARKLAVEFGVTVDDLKLEPDDV